MSFFHNQTKVKLFNSSRDELEMGEYEYRCSKHIVQVIIDTYNILYCLCVSCQENVQIQAVYSQSCMCHVVVGIVCVV